MLRAELLVATAVLLSGTPGAQTESPPGPTGAQPQEVPLSLGCGYLQAKQDLDSYARWLWVNQMGIIQTAVKGQEALQAERIENFRQCPGTKSSPLRRGLANYTLGVTYRAIGKVEEAVAVFVQLLESDDLAAAPTERVSSAVHLFSLFARHGREQQAIGSLTAILEEQGASLSPQIAMVAEHALAVAHERLGQFSEARRRYERAIDAADRSRHNAFKWSNSASLLAERRSIFLNFIDFLLNRGDHETALAVLEKAGTNELLETLFLPEAEAAARRSELLSAKTVKDLQYTRILGPDSMTGDRSPERRAAEDEAIQRLTAQALGELTSTGESGPPPATSEPPSLTELKRALASLPIPQRDRALLYVADLGYYPAALFLRTSRGLSVVRLPMVAVEMLADLERYGLCVRDAACDSWRSIGAELYRRILGPIADELARVSHLSIHATGLFRQLAFEALVDDEGRPLGVTKAIVYSPGARYESALSRRAASTTPTGRVGIVRGDRSAVESILAEATQGRRCAKRSPPFEAKTSASLELALDVLADVELALFSAHGWFLRDLPTLSSFELPDGNGTRGFLPVHRLGRVSFSSALVVLSSCQLGLEYATPFGEGFYPTAVLLAAGAEVVVAASGDVPVRSTDALLGDFFRHLGEGREMAEALQRARSSAFESEENGAHPIHWALVLQFGVADKTLC